MLGSSNDKDGVLFPRKFSGHWAMLHRQDAGGTQHIWSAYSPNLIHWGEPHCVLVQGEGAAWDGLKVGAGPPPILTDKGWLPRSTQIGVTGHSIAPKLVVTVGASGRFNYTVGIRNAEISLAIDVNPEAEIFDQVDIGLCGPWQELVPALTSELTGRVLFCHG